MKCMVCFVFWECSDLMSENTLSLSVGLSNLCIVAGTSSQASGSVKTDGNSTRPHRAMSPLGRRRAPSPVYTWNRENVNKSNSY